jgi:hypothetical protein
MTLFKKHHIVVKLSNEDMPKFSSVLIFLIKHILNLYDFIWIYILYDHHLLNETQ